MNLGLKNKVAVVTGARKGIGLAITKALVAEGGRVIAAARDIGTELRSLAEGGLVQCRRTAIMHPSAFRMAVT